MATALVGTAFGVGALGQEDDVSDGAAWLWNSSVGEAIRVNGNNAEIDLVASLPESEGGRVEVEQNDDYLLLTDPETGRVTSVDLDDLGFSGRLDLGGGDFAVILGKSAAVVVDRAAGEVRAVDPATLQATGASLTLEGPLVGGGFDDSDTLWLGVPAQGNAVGIQVTEGEAAITQTVAVSSPGSDIGVTVFDDGAMVLDRGGDRAVAMREGDEPVMVTMPVTLEGSQMPARTHGDMAAVTKTEDGEIVTLLHPYGAAQTSKFPLGHPGGGLGVPFEGRVYVPYDDEGVVRSYTPNGRELDTVTLPDAEGPLELEAREGSLFVSAPDTGAAAVIDPSGQATLVDLAEPPPGPGELRGESPTSSDAPGTGRPENLPEAGGDPGQDGGGSNAAGGAGEPTEETGGPPGAPTPVTAEAGNGDVRLSWTEAYSPDAPVTSYEITWDGGETTVAGDELDTEVSGLENGTVYRFRVRAVNEHGTGPAAQSSQVTPDSEAPGAPGEVSVEVIDARTATVSWGAADDATDYLVSTTETGGGSAPADRTGAQTSLDVTGLTEGGTYTFTVTSRGTGGVTGESVTSDPVTMPEAEVGDPGEVSHGVSGTDVTVTWAAAENAEGYRITPMGDAVDFATETTVEQTTSQTFTRTVGAHRCFSFTVTALGPGDTEGGSVRSASSCLAPFE